MPYQESIAQVEADIAAGRFADAREGLLPLIKEYPDNFWLREKMGDVCWRLGAPVEAGGWWCLLPQLTPQQAGAVAEFLAFHAGDPVAVLAQIQFHGDARLIRDQVLEERLPMLRDHFFRLRQEQAALRPAPMPGPQVPIEERWRRFTLALIFACLLVLAAFLYGVWRLLAR